MTDFEQNLQNSLFSGKSEKTFIDKLLAKDDAISVREIIRKKKLEREDLVELLYLLSGTEAKLLNYSEWDRYVILKFFIWIREFVKVAENLYDYQDDLNFKQNLCLKCEKLFNKVGDQIKECECTEPVKPDPLNSRTKKLLFNNERNIEHAAKFLIDLYFNIARTTLSLRGTGFIEMLKNKFEISYPQGSGLQTPLQQEKPSLFGTKKN